MKKSFGHETFVTESGYIVVCYQTTGHHYAECKDLGLKGCYGFCNRPWESFTFDTALTRLADKVKKEFGTAAAEEFYTLHDKVGGIETERCEKMFSSFKSAYDNASEKMKETLKEGNVMMNSETDVEFMTAALKLSSILG